MPQKNYSNFKQWNLKELILPQWLCSREVALQLQGWQFDLGHVHIVIVALCKPLPPHCFA